MPEEDNEEAQQQTAAPGSQQDSDKKKKKKVKMSKQTNQPPLLSRTSLFFVFSVSHFDLSDSSCDTTTSVAVPTCELLFYAALTEKL